METTRWQTIPPEILVEVYFWLELEDQCAVAATCKHWREAFFAPKLLRTKDLHLYVYMNLEFEKTKFLSKFTRFAKSFHIDWPKMSHLHVDTPGQWDTQNALAISALIAQLKLNDNLKSLKLKLENPASRQDSFVKSVQDDLKQILLKCSDLRYISFGCHPLIIPQDLNDVLLQGKVFQLTDLHIANAWADATDELCINQGLAAEVAGQLMQLQNLSLNWEDMTDDLLRALIKRRTKVQMEKLILFTDLRKNCETLHPSYRQWNELCIKNPKIQIYIIFCKESQGQTFKACLGLQNIDHGHVTFQMC